MLNSQFFTLIAARKWLSYRVLRKNYRKGEAKL